MATQVNQSLAANQSTGEYHWNWAYRIDHWVRVLALVVLTVSGFYIQWPWRTGDAGYVAGSFPTMAWMRFAHFVAGYIFLLGLIVRLYLAFNSKFVADWRDFGIWRNLRRIPDITLYYLFLKRSHQNYRRYNPLQALTYLFWAVIIVVQSLTGFALYHGNVFGILPAPESFMWVQHLLGGEPNVRLVHQLVMWLFLITAAVHVYMAAMVTWTERDHSFRAMFTGYRKRPAGNTSSPPDSSSETLESSQSDHE